MVGHFEAGWVLYVAVWALDREKAMQWEKACLLLMDQEGQVSHRRLQVEWVELRPSEEGFCEMRLFEAC